MIRYVWIELSVPSILIFCYDIVGRYPLLDTLGVNAQLTTFDNN